MERGACDIRSANSPERARKGRDNLEDPVGNQGEYRRGWESLEIRGKKTEPLSGARKNQIQ